MVIFSLSAMSACISELAAPVSMRHSILSLLGGTIIVTKESLVPRLMLFSFALIKSCRCWDLRNEMVLLMYADILDVDGGLMKLRTSSRSNSG